MCLKRAPVMLAVFLVAAAGLSLQSAPGAGCREVTKKLGKWNVKVLCGPAKATVIYQGKSYPIRRGTCTRAKAGFEIRVGTDVVNTLTGRERGVPDYFELLVGKGFGLEPILGPQPAVRGDGVYRRGFVVWNVGGRAHFIGGGMTITLRKNRTEGSFAIGKSSLSAYGAVRGTFSC